VGERQACAPRFAAPHRRQTCPAGVFFQVCFIQVARQMGVFFQGMKEFGE
jgi:hypothetical protein